MHFIYLLSLCLSLTITTGSDAECPQQNCPACLCPIYTPSKKDTIAVIIDYGVKLSKRLHSFHKDTTIKEIETKIKLSFNNELVITDQHKQLCIRLTKDLTIFDIQSIFDDLVRTTPLTFTVAERDFHSFN